MTMGYTYRIWLGYIYIYADVICGWIIMTSLWRHWKDTVATGIRESSPDGRQTILGYIRDVYDCGGIELWDIIGKYIPSGYLRDDFWQVAARKPWAIKKKKFEDLLFLEMVICLICIDYVKRPDIIYSMDVWDIIGIYRQENPADVSFRMIYESVHYSIQMAGFLMFLGKSWGCTVEETQLA